MIFTGNVSEEGQRIVKAGRKKEKEREGGMRSILTPGLVILFMVNTVSTLAVKEKTPFLNHISKCNLVFILAVAFFLMNGFFCT